MPSTRWHICVGVKCHDKGDGQPWVALQYFRLFWPEFSSMVTQAQ
jgi:hypothetical protein